MTSFIRGEQPTPEELAEMSRLCEMHVDKDGRVMHIMRRADVKPKTPSESAPSASEE